ncbi:hypothetical protein [Luteolibacter luteus]|uniref:Uncharacterized protein n=1 Tax=Luteolibacter luteus TaxID=2728835 RepID=A0A858RDZ4_9BACT|nr:hypothetical protein [Luteolibacter luteus]QJE94798.1 hypothetical protein HHL09_03050 [Luteolibacter luteus]
MQLELPERLLVTRDVLTRSLLAHPEEKAPAMPASLAADLAGRFAPKAASRKDSACISWLDKVKNFLATPGFGAVAAAVVVLGVAVPMFSQGDHAAPKESFRGGEAIVATGEQTRIFFVGENAEIRAAVESSGNFESSALATAPSVEAVKEERGAKVVVDLNTGTVTAYGADGEALSQKMIPTDTSKVAGVIAKMVAGL